MQARRAIVCLRSTETLRAIHARRVSNGRIEEMATITD